jgi:hypothetical protein
MIEPFNDDILDQLTKGSEPEVSGTKRMFALFILLLIVASFAGVLGLIIHLLTRTQWL